MEGEEGMRAAPWAFRDRSAARGSFCGVKSTGAAAVFVDEAGVEGLKAAVEEAEEVEEADGGVEGVEDEGKIGDDVEGEDDEAAGDRCLRTLRRSPPTPA